MLDFAPPSVGKIGKCRSISAVMPGPDKLLPRDLHENHEQNSAYQYKVHERAIRKGGSFDSPESCRAIVDFPTSRRTGVD